MDKTPSLLRYGEGCYEVTNLTSVIHTQLGIKYGAFHLGRRWGPSVRSVTSMALPALRWLGSS
jgi:hypothetical protein